MKPSQQAMQKLKAVASTTDDFACIEETFAVEYESVGLLLSVLIDNQERFNLTDTHLDVIIGTCYHLIYAYQGEIRQKETLARRKNMPSFLHLIQVTLYGLGAFAWAAAKGVSDLSSKEVSGENGIPTQHDRSVQAYESFLTVMDQNDRVFECVMSALLHDTAEDLKGVIQGDKYTVASHKKGVHTPITENKHTQLIDDNLDVFVSDLHELLSENENYFKEITWTGSYLLKKFRDRRLHSDAYTQEQNNVLPKALKQRILELHEKDEYIELLTQVSLMRQYIAIRLLGTREQTANNIIGTVNKVTIRKHADAALKDKEKKNMIKFIKHDFSVFFVKFGDVMHNAMTLAENKHMKKYISFLKQVKDALQSGAKLPLPPEYTSEEQRLKDKYEDYIHLLFYAGFGWISDKKFVGDLVGMFSLYELSKHEEYNLRSSKHSSFSRDSVDLKKDNLFVLWMDIGREYVKLYKNMDYTSVTYEEVQSFIGNSATSEDYSHISQMKKIGLGEVHRQLDADSVPTGLSLMGDLSALDFFRMDDLSLGERQKLLISLVGKNNCVFEGHSFKGLTKKGYTYINSLYQRALDFSVNHLGTHVPRQLTDVNFTSMKKIHHFLDGTGKENMYRSVRCELLKNMYEEAIFDRDAEVHKRDRDLYNHVVTTLLGFGLGGENKSGLVKALSPTYADMLEEKFLAITDNNEQARQEFQQLVSQMKFTRTDEGLEQQLEILEQAAKAGKYNPDITDFISDIMIHGLYMRLKQSIPIKLKLIAEPKYERLALIRDDFQLRLQVDTVDDAVMLAQYMYTNFYKQGAFGDFEMKVKNIFNENSNGSASGKEIFKQTYGPDTTGIIGSDLPRIHTDLYQVMTESFKGKSDLKGDKNRTEIKLTGPILPGSALKVETQIVLMDNTNEVGLAHHGVYEIKRVLKAKSRNVGIIDDAYIDRIIDMHIQKHGRDLLIIGGFHPGSTRRIIRDHLLKDDDYLIEIQMSQEQKKKATNKKYYMVKERYAALNFWGLMNEDTIQGADRERNGKFVKGIPDDWWRATCKYLEALRQDVEIQLKNVFSMKGTIGFRESVGAIPLYAGLNHQHMLDRLALLQKKLEGLIRDLFVINTKSMSLNCLSRQAKRYLLSRLPSFEDRVGLDIETQREELSKSQQVVLYEKYRAFIDTANESMLPAKESVFSAVVEYYGELDDAQQTFNNYERRLNENLAEHRQK